MRGLHKLIAVAMAVMLAAVTVSAAEFRAFYTHLPIENDDPPDKVGEHADIVVQVGTNRAFVFARDSSYLPCLVAGGRKTYVDELVARTGDGTDKRPDKINRYSHVRLIENTPEKAVVHWRYMADFGNVQWDGVVDEYFTIDPDGNVERVVRKGTPKRTDWDDPSNRHVQTFRLTGSGIRDVKTRAPSLSHASGQAIQGTRTRNGALGTPVARFRFDEGLEPNGDVTTESVSGFACPVGGHKTVWRAGVSGSCLLFDGYYSKVTLPRDKAPALTDQMTAEAWVAVGAYPFNWAPIVHHSTWEDKGYYLGIDSYGHLAFMADIGGRWQKVQASTGTFETDIELFRWYHVAASYDGAAMRLYINGEEAASEPASGAISLPERDLVVGLNLDKLTPTSPIRTWATYPSIFGIDGLIDNVSIHRSALSAADIRTSFRNFSPSAEAAGKPDLEARDLPANPRGRKAGSFGASYQNLPFHSGFDNLWRVSDHPDIVVNFDQSPCRVVFWRGLRYAPALVTENGRWSGDQSAECGEKWGEQLPFDYPDAVGCCEHMSDAQARHSHVRIIESTPARVVIHWRYAEIDVRYIRPNDGDGWGAWADEYHTIYPDGVGIRHVARCVGGWQETMFYNGPGTRPEDNVEMDAYTLVNTAGDERTYSWAKAPQPYPAIPGDLNIKGGPFVSMVNFKSKYRSYYVYPKGSGVSTFSGEVRPEFSRFPWWNHYPVSQAISDGRSAERPDRMTHSSLVWGGPSKAWLMVGLTDRPAASLLPLARSWDSPPPMEDPLGAVPAGYLPGERAYRLRAEAPEVSFELQSTADTPVVNPCFVIENWGNQGDAQVGITGAKETDIRQGTITETDGRYAKVIWVELEATSPVKFTIRGATPGADAAIPTLLAPKSPVRKQP